MRRAGPSDDRPSALKGKAPRMELQPIATRIRAARDGHGLSNSELADRLGINSTTAIRWTHGVQAPRADQLARLCRELTISADWLLGLPEAQAPDLTPPPEWELSAIPGRDPADGWLP